MKARRTDVFLDYQVIDHLRGLKHNAYRGQHRTALSAFREAAENRRVGVWMADITHVEMLLGRENPDQTPELVARWAAKDDEKLAIAKALGVRWLGYPASRVGDEYSRLGVTTQVAGRDWGAARRLEMRLLDMQGVSPGDARQVATFAFGTDPTGTWEGLEDRWFVTHDEKLRRALESAVKQGALPELRGTSIGSSSDLETRRLRVD